MTTRPGVGVLVAIALLVVPACGDDRSDPAGDAELTTIGLVTNNVNGLRNVNGFVDRMAELGYVGGETVVYRFAGEPLTDSDLDRELERFADEDVDLVFTAGTPTGVAAQRILAATGTPIVFGVIADPIAAGVMDDLSHPGGHMTGVMLGADQIRRLELLTEIAPTVRRVLVPYNPDDAAAASAVEQIVPVADLIGVELVLVEARSDDEVTELIDGLSDDVDAVFLVPDSTVNARLADLLDRAVELSLPTSGPSTAQVEEGALTTYGFVHEQAGAQAARIAVQVLRGAEPGDLPVEETESFLGINLMTAAAIDLEIDDAILQQAQIIIRPPTGEATP